MKKYLAAALLCLVLEGVYWRPLPDPALPEGRFSLVSVPPAEWQDVQGQASGRTPHSFSVQPKHSLRVAAFGYQPVVLTVDQPTVVKLRLDALGYLVHHAFAWLGLACLGLAWRARVQSRPTPPRRVGPYVLHEKVGEGATAEVYRASAPDGRVVALKWLHEQTGGTQEYAARFKREAEICKGLKHPGIVGVHDWGEAEERLWMAQDWIEGSTLASRPLPLPPGEVRRLLMALCEALDYAHRAGVIHRDLKPSNILLRADGQPVIADFGLARSAHYATITKTETTLGTPTYMPPEQILGQRADGRSDLYSLGCMAFEMLTGQLPFLGSDAIKTLLAHLHDPPPPLPQLPEHWQRLVHHLLAKEPSVRPESAGQVFAVLESFGESG